jgi:predicted alpha/beta-hydrolase family hydrolase
MVAAVAIGAPLREFVLFLFLHCRAVNGENVVCWKSKVGMTSFLIDGPEDASATLMLAHGAGAPMDSASMTAAAKALAAEGIRVVRFEFAYMAGRREGLRKPPPKAEKVMPEYLAAVEALGPVRGRLFIGGKSMGGRVASMVADELFAAGRIAGLVCLGYPFHPPGKPEQLRTAHLEGLKTPALIVQGTRDEFGTRDEVAGYTLSLGIELLWLEDGDHDLKPRKSVSGFSAADHLRTMASETARWMKRVTA